MQADLQAVPCLLVALIAHPSTHHPILFRVSTLYATPAVPQLEAF